MSVTLSTQSTKTQSIFTFFPNTFSFDQAGDQWDTDGALQDDILALHRETVMCVYLVTFSDRPLSTLFLEPRDT